MGCRGARPCANRQPFRLEPRDVGCMVTRSATKVDSGFTASGFPASGSLRARQGPIRTPLTQEPDGCRDEPAPCRCGLCSRSRCSRNRQPEGDARPPLMPAIGEELIQRRRGETSVRASGSRRGAEGKRAFEPRAAGAAPRGNERSSLGQPARSRGERAFEPRAAGPCASCGRPLRRGRPAPAPRAAGA